MAAEQLLQSTVFRSVGSHSDLELFMQVISLQVLIRLVLALRILEHKFFQPLSRHLVTGNFNCKGNSKFEKFSMFKN